MNLDIKLYSIVTCPVCGFVKNEKMPEDSCMFFYECTNCKSTIRAQKRDCCVFCSYGDTKCPSNHT